jgi:hypothetical protein
MDYYVSRNWDTFGDTCVLYLMEQRNVCTSVTTYEYMHVLHTTATINNIEPSVFVMEKEELRIEVHLELVFIFLIITSL